MLVVVIFFFFLPLSSGHCPTLFNNSTFISPVTIKRLADKCLYELAPISSCVLDLNSVEVNVGDELKCWVWDENDQNRAGCQCEEWQCESYKDEVKEHFEMFGRMWRRQVAARPCIYKSSMTGARSKQKKRGSRPVEKVEQYVRENYSNIIVILVALVLCLLGIMLIGFGTRCYRHRARKRRSEKERLAAMETASEQDTEK